MHPDIDRMIKMAQSRGSITAAQHDMILNKAKELGDDPMEIEFVLSGLSITDTQTSQSTNQSGHTSFHQQNTYQQPHSSNVYQQNTQPNAFQQNNPGTTMPDTQNKTSLILGIGSTALGVISFAVLYATILISVLGLAAGIYGLIRSNKEKKQFAEANTQTNKNPYQIAFVLSIIGIAISGFSFLIDLSIRSL